MELEGAMVVQGLERGGVRLPVERYKDWLDGSSKYGSLLCTSTIINSGILGI